MPYSVGGHVKRGGYVTLVINRRSRIASSIGELVPAIAAELVVVSLGIALRTVLRYGLGNGLAASGALAEIRTCCLDSLRQRRIVQLAAHHLLHFVDRRARPAPTAQKVTCNI